MRRSFSGVGIKALKAEGADKSNRYELSFSSEEPYERWFGAEVLSHKDGALNLDRLNTIGTLLFNHNADRPIGAIEKAWIEDGRGKAIVRFDTDEDSETIRQKVENGSLRGVSVGYIVDNYEEVKQGKTSKDGFAGPCYVATKWEALEISIVSVPADSSVGVGRSAMPKKKTQDESKKGVSCLYFMSKQLQINTNKLLLKGGRA